MSDTPDGDICKLSADLGWAADTLHVVDKELIRMSKQAYRLHQERDEARAALADWANAAKHVEADHPDEVHCGCVPILRKLLNDARGELNTLTLKLTDAENAAMDARKKADALCAEMAKRKAKK